MNISSELQFDISDQLNQRFGIFGMSGSGKSNTLRTVLEEIVLSGQPIPMTVVDPEDEYWSLKEAGQFIVVGEETHADIPCNVFNAPQLAQYSVEQGVSVILSLSHLNDQEAQDFLEAYLSGLWRAQSRKRRPYLLAVEEAHEFAHQRRPGTAKDILIRLAKRGRKKGLIMLFSTQRPAALDKDIVTQLTTLFLHRVAYPSDIAVYREVVPLKGSEVEKLVQGLHVGEAIVVREGGRVDVGQIRRATTFDAGATPGFDIEDLPQIRDIDSGLIAELSHMLKTSAPVIDPHLVEARRRIGELEDLLHAANEALRVCDEDRDTLRRQLATQNGNGAHHMHVDAIHADAIYASTVEGSAGSPFVPDSFAATEFESSAEAPVQDLLDAADRRREQNHQALISRQRAVFEKLLRKLSDSEEVKAAWRDVFYWLMAHPQKRYHINELCKVLSFDINTIRRCPPILLIEGLVSRDGSGRDAIYWSTAREALAEAYPALDIEQIYDALLNLMNREKA